MDNFDDAYTEETKESWRMTMKVMDHDFYTRLDEKIFDGIREMSIYHGLKKTSMIILDKNFINITFCPITKEYLLLEPATEIQRFSMQGKHLNPSYALPSEPFTEMLWCDNVESFACYIVESDTIRFFSSTCQLIKSIVNEFPISSVYYLLETNELVVLGADQMVKYLLDFEEEELFPSNAVRFNDPDFGVSWLIEKSCLIPQNLAVESSIVASYALTLYLLSLDFTREADYEGNVEFLDRRLNTIKAPASIIYFHESSLWIIIGDIQGNVTCWTVDFECTFFYMGAHDEAIRIIAPHPTICGFLTCSDGRSKGISKMQVWSCNFKQPIESFDSFGIINGISVNKEAAGMAILSRQRISFLTMFQTYWFYASLTDPAVSLQSTSNPMHTTKITAACADNSVRTFESNGNLIHIQVLPKEPIELTFAIYSHMEYKLFSCITKNGDVLVSSTSAYPIKFKHIVINDGPRITVMTIYEHYDEIRTKDRRPRKPRLFYPIYVLIIAGTEDGNLIVINDATGNRISTDPAHQGSVTKLHVSSECHRLISLGIDRCVKIWRILADLSTPLVLYYTLYFIIPISLISYMGDVLCMSNTSENSKVHQVIMENIEERVYLEHNSTQDHTARITNMICSEIMEICATSSLDRTIRIWDRDNCLIKVLIINVCVPCMAFSSIRGDIIFSAGRHLFKIPYENYLPSKYRVKIISDNIANEELIQSKWVGSGVDVPDEENAILHPSSSLPLVCLDTGEDAVKVNELVMKQMCTVYLNRDKEITHIKDNYLKPRKIATNRELMNEENWQIYVKDLLEKFKPMKHHAPPYKFQNLFKEKSIVKKSLNEPGIFKMLYGYGIENVDYEDNVFELIAQSKLSVNGFLPNSVIYKPYKKIVKRIVPPEVKKRPPRVFMQYRYPPEFYPPRESEGQKSLRLSQLMLNVDTENKEETEAP